ncbi:MAG: ATP-binding protein [Fluviibacter sp.]
MTANDFKLDFSNRVIEHLGIKLYQNKTTNVIAEFISNSWDAGAKHVAIDLIAGDTAQSRSIVITDDGLGMTRDEIINDFLVIGRNRRKTPTEKANKNRAPMGRKGIGKLAGFGIAKSIDIISMPNPALRSSGGFERKAYWLRFHLDKIIAESSSRGAGGYHPEVIADGLTANELEKKVKELSLETTFNRFLSQIHANEGGLCIHLNHLTTKRNTSPEALLSSLGNRFTVTLQNPDFMVTVNGKGLAPEDVFPKFHDFGFGSHDSPITETIEICGTPREVSYWVKFVALSDSDWPLESAGVGIYTHGKIAQDRPFFFDVKGKEIFSRYLYGFITADWLDELPQDVVSTDRRSVNWEDEHTEALHKWGASKLSGWVESFRKWRKEQPKKEIIERIRNQAAGQKLTGTEEEALADLLSDVLPSLGNDEEAKNNATSSLTSAWTHAPTRKLTQTLWHEVFSNEDGDLKSFSALIDKLRSSLVPEAMSLAVTLSQRVAAITALRKTIESDKTETHLQKLIEEFPWLLGPSWDKLTANQTIRTLVRDKFKPNKDVEEWDFDLSHNDLKPDFVFLADPGAEREIVVFELKGPESHKTLQPCEYKQLGRYLDIIQGAYPSLEVEGVLIGHDKGGFKENRKDITIKTWDEILLSARKLHVSYLASLLEASNPDADDARLEQISDFGGKETLELLNRLNAITTFSPVISAALQPDMNT